MIHVLDTNILSKAFSGRSVPARQRLLAANPASLRVPTIVIAEIQFGILKSDDPARMRERWDRFLSPFARLAFDEPAAIEHARLRWALRHQPIGERDLVIAAIATVQRATVVTNNRSEFDRVPDLLVEDWT